jgi:enoyl-CoA hydratase
MSEVVLYEVSDRVATVTLNRPEVRNALSTEVRRRLWQRMEQAEADDTVDVVVLTGVDPAFCAGLDLKELGAGGPTAGTSAPEAEATSPVPAMAKPLIGAINGVAVTGGLELALACDFLVASERARFADTHSRVGIQPGWGLTVGLAAAVGVRRAKELSATGNFLDAPTALAWGLVNHVVAHDELLGFTLRLAADVVSNDQAGVRRLLRTYDEGSLVTGSEAAALEVRVSREWMATGQGGSPTDVEGRRREVVDRGRSQAG